MSANPPWVLNNTQHFFSWYYFKIVTSLGLKPRVSIYLPHLTLLLAFWQSLIRSTPLALLWPAWCPTEVKEKCQYCDADSCLAGTRVPTSSRMDYLIIKTVLGLKVPSAMNVADGSPCHSHHAHCNSLPSHIPGFPCKAPCTPLMYLELLWTLLHHFLIQVQDSASDLFSDTSNSLFCLE